VGFRPPTARERATTIDKIYPYLLRGIEITRPNQVWAMDISYIPMARGFVYLAVVLDFFGHAVDDMSLSLALRSYSECWSRYWALNVDADRVTTRRFV
jgi:putative transposase